MHVSRDVHFSHSRIHKRYPGFSLFPPLKPFFIRMPFHLVELFFKIFLSLQNTRKLVGYVCEELSPMQLKNQMIVFSKHINNLMINFPDWYVGKVEISRKFGCRQSRIVPVFKVVLEVHKVIQDLQGILPSPPDSQIIILVVQLISLNLKIIADLQLIQLIQFLELKVLEIVRLSYLVVVVAVQLKRGESWGGVQFAHKVHLHQIIKSIVLLRKHLDLSLSCPFFNLPISFLSIWCVVQIKGYWINFYFVIYAIQNLQIVSVKVVNFAIVLFYLFI